MRKWTLFVIAMMLAQQSSAASDSAYLKAMRAQQNFTMEMDAAADISDIINKKYADKCENFAGNGEVRKWGRIVEKELARERQRALYEAPGDLKQICPAYTRLNDEDKKGLWILIVSAMTHYESSCIITEDAKGPNGTAAGLLQLHRGQEARYSKGCRNGDSGFADRSLICGISMLNDQIERGEPLFSKRSYWEVLRPRGRSKRARNIMAVISQYPACESRPDNNSKVSATKKPKALAKR
jgi:hypothetical protein